jgi:PAS domain S-box-containing protein
MKFDYQFSELTTDMMGIFDFSGRLILGNQRWTQVLGWTDDQLKANNYTYFVHPEDLERSVALKDELFSGKTVRAFENRWRCHDGTFRSIHWSFSYNSVAQHVFAVGTDITSLKRDYHLLEETQRIARIAGWEVNFLTGHTYWTQEAYRLHEVSNDFQPSLEKAFTFYPPESQEKLQRATQFLIEHKEPIELDLELISAKNNRFQIRSRALPLIVEDKVIGAIGTLQNVTESKLYQEELIKTKEKALAATEAKSLFLANMSHEIRTPMNSILGMADLLLDSELNTEQMQFVHILNRAAGSLLDIINDILDMSRIEAGQLYVQSIPFNVRETVEKSLEIFLHKAGEKGLQISSNIDSRVPEVWIGDPQRLRQVLINLIGNAVKFTDVGTVEIKTEMNNGELKISVADTGIGIHSEQLLKIFDRFTQGDASITRKYGGTGLGLHITKNLLEKMGGQVQVDSVIGKGSNFSLSLPAISGQP